METKDLIESLYAAEVRKLAIKMHNFDRMKTPEEERDEFDKGASLNAWVLRAHIELQAVRQLLDKEAQESSTEAL